MMTIDDHKLETEIFPRLVQKLREAGEVFVDYDYAPNFAHYMMRRDYELWQRLEQELEPTDDLQARFFLRNA